MQKEKCLLIQFGFLYLNLVLTMSTPYVFKIITSSSALEWLK